MDEKERWWIFTFGCGQKHGGHYVKFFGTYGVARQKMFDKYGTTWAFQYSEEEWDRMVSDPNRSYPIETELKEKDDE